MDGDQFIARLRASPAAGVPVVAFAATRESEAWAREFGAVGFIAKPVELDTLLATMRRATGAAAP